MRFLNFKRFLCVLFSVICVSFVFSGCSNSDEKEWNHQTGSLLAFPFGCTVEQAQELLGLTDADKGTVEQFSGAEHIGMDHRYINYQLPQGHAYPFDYLILTEEQCVDGSGTVYPIGVTEIAMGYLDERYENGERVEIELTKKQLRAISKMFDKQVKRCKASYTAEVIGFDKNAYPTPASGVWTKEKWESLGDFPEKHSLPEYDYALYQSRYPLMMAYHSDSRITFTGKYDAMTKANLPDVWD